VKNICTLRDWLTDIAPNCVGYCTFAAWLTKFPQSWTSRRRAAATICLRPYKLTISSYLFARWHLFRHVDYLRHRQQVDFWPFDLESGVRVACDVGYLCSNFSLPRLLCSLVTPDVRDRQTSGQTDVRQKHRLMALPYGAEA